MALSRGPAPARRDPGKQRVLGMTAGVLAAFLVVIGQLWYLQVLEGARLQELSDKNRIRIRPVAAPRGVLFDRNGLPLAARGHAPRARRQRSGNRPGPPRLQQGDESRSFSGYVGRVS